MIVDQLERVFSTRGWLSRQPQPFRTRFIGLGRLIALERLSGEMPIDFRRYLRRIRASKCVGGTHPLLGA